MNKIEFIIPPNTPFVIMKRRFNAPRERVFEAYTDPELIPQWWGPRKYTTHVDRMEVKKGGVWRYVQRGPGGEFAFNGVYHEIITPEMLINTFEFEGLPGPGHVGLIITSFEAHSNQTLLIEKSIFPSVEDRDGIVSSGMEIGSTESMDRFEEMLDKDRK